MRSCVPTHNYLSTRSHAEVRREGDSEAHGLDVSGSRLQGDRRSNRAFAHSGITIIVGSTISLLIGMTWGGLRFRWDSAHVLVPLVIGGIGIVAFFVYEKVWSGHTVCFHARRILTC